MLKIRRDLLVQKAYGQLVLLSFAISDFTPVAYQGHSL